MRKMVVGDASILNKLNGLAVFLFGALALVIDSGYSVGPVILLLCSCLLLVNKPVLKLQSADKALMLVFFVYFLTEALEIWLNDSGLRELDKSIRFLLGIPVLLALLAFPPRLGMFWWGVVFGAIGAGIIAIYQKLGLGMGRAQGYMHPIQFGDISMLLGVIALVGIGYAKTLPFRMLGVSLFILAAMLGIAGSLLSGSRGGWIGLPLILLVIYRGYSQFISARIKVFIFVLVVGIVFAVYMLPQTGVKQRVWEAVQDVEKFYLDDNPDTSVGRRLEMWRLGLTIFPEKPVFGWGESGYVAKQAELIEQGNIHQSLAGYRHLHNEVLNALVTSGIVGLMALLALYLVPLRLFGRYLRASDIHVKSLAIAGVLVPVAFIDFGLSQVLFSHNSGVMVYTFMLVILWALLRNELRASMCSMWSIT